MNAIDYAATIIPGIQDMLARDAKNGKLDEIDHISIGKQTLEGLRAAEAITTEDHTALQAGERVSMTFTVDGGRVALPLAYDPAEDGFVSRTARGDMVL